TAVGGALSAKRMPDPGDDVRILGPSAAVSDPGAPVTNVSPDGGAERERVQPEVLEPQAPPGSPLAPEEGEQVTRPTKLIRIASMVRTMLDEVRRAPLDDAGRRRLREIHERSLEELESVLSPELQKELAEVVLPLTSDAPTESELRLAQAQLVGWL